MLFLSFQDLFLYHKVVSEIKYSKSKPSVAPKIPLLTQMCLDFLTDTLYQTPPLGHVVIGNLLLPSHVQHEKNNHMFYGIYVQCLQTVVSEISNHFLKSDTQKAPTHLLPVEENVSKLLDLLSLFDPPSSFRGHAVIQILEGLCNICNMPNTPVQIAAIYSCLLGKSSNYLLEEFTQLMHQERVKDLKETAGVERMIEGNSNTFLELSEAGKALLGLCRQHTRKDGIWNDVYFLCLEHQRHFLDLIVVSTYLIYF